MKTDRNIVGSQIRTIREQCSLSLKNVAARCSDLGWEVSPQILSSIEARERPIRDFELLCLSKALKVSPNAFSSNDVALPKIPRRSSRAAQDERSAHP
jgi:transcriptional regulator with XRE-family HTH domain